MPEKKKVFVPTGEIRLPRLGEYFWWDRANKIEQAEFDFERNEYEIYEVIEVDG